MDPLESLGLGGPVHLDSFRTHFNDIYQSISIRYAKNYVTRLLVDIFLKEEWVSKVLIYSITTQFSSGKMCFENTSINQYLIKMTFGLVNIPNGIHINEQFQSLK